MGSRKRIGRRRGRGRERELGRGSRLGGGRGWRGRSRWGERDLSVEGEKKEKEVSGDGKRDATSSTRF